ncbi:MAG: ABC-type Fe3+-hydroxamate transport system substrate-binding protein, partial [Francisellaceae bacterium]
MLTLISHMFSAYLKNKSLSIVFLFIVSITTYADSSTQKRIVILSPNLVEISHMIIEKSKTKDIIIVGIIHYPGEPSYAKNIDGIGTSSNINVEKILLLKPNIVLASAGNNSLSLQQIKSFNVKVDIYNTQSLAGIAKLILQVGNSLHLETTSAIISNNYLLQLKSYRKKFHLDKKIKTFIQLSELPIFAVGGDGVINEIIELCGGKNIFWNIKKFAFQAGKSSVLNKDPEL